MERHFEHELDQLKSTLMGMGTLVLEQLDWAARGILDHTDRYAVEVLERDTKVDGLEVQVDMHVLDLLALQHPMASDLRLIVAVQKINNDLERIGDHAVNIAQSAVSLARKHSEMGLLDIPEMAVRSHRMLADALQSLATLDPQKAQQVILEDDLIDSKNRELCSRVITGVKSDNESLEWGLDLIRVSRNFERVADLATNVAEEVIFLTQARVVKHRLDERL